MNSVRLDDSKLKRIMRETGSNTSQVIRSIAFAVEAIAKTKAPVDTGALRASIFTKMKGDSNMPDVPAGAQRADISEPADNQTAHVGPSVEYGAAVELGTARNAAQPYLIPAVRQVSQDLQNNPGIFKKVVLDE